MAGNRQALAAEEPGEIEALLPWHVAGTLNARDARRVEEAVARDPGLARQCAIIREEYAETILLNESLGAPSARAMQKLFAAIDAEPVQQPVVIHRSFSTRIHDFFSSLSPRTLAAASAVAVIALVFEAGVIASVLATKESPGAYQTASAPAPAIAGTRAMVRFVPEATAADIGAFLARYDAAVVGSASGGLFRIQFGAKPLARGDADALLKQVQAEKIVGLVTATD